MTLQQLLYALTIAEKGSMNKAAESLFISQPSLTLAMKDLEKEIGITIFRRSSRGVQLTNEGADFLVSARQIYQQYELLKDKYSGTGDIKRKFAVSTQHYSFITKAFVETVKQYDTKNFDFAIRETKTQDVISDVGKLRSEIGILFESDFNRKVITKMLRDNDLEFTKLIDCRAYVYIWKNHPLAGEASISLNMLKDYPCLSFEQGDQSSLYLAEEILGETEYPRTIKTTDRATMLNLMVGLNGYTLCSGIICEELNGSDYVAIPFKEDRNHRNTKMTIGYVTKRHSIMSDIGKTFIDEVEKYLKAISD